MNLNFLRPAFVLLWLVVGLAIIFRKSLGIEFFDDKWIASDLDFAAFAIFALALWNGFRWWSSRRNRREDRPPSNPLQPRDVPRPFEYNPDLDFTKPTDDPRPR